MGIKAAGHERQPVDDPWLRQGLARSVGGAGGQQDGQNRG